MHLKEEIPRMEYIIYTDPRGLRNYNQNPTTCPLSPIPRVPPAIQRAS
jgi:hypothetical protein